MTVEQLAAKISQVISDKVSADEYVKFAALSDYDLIRAYFTFIDENTNEPLIRLSDGEIDILAIGYKTLRQVEEGFARGYIAYIPATDNEVNLILSMVMEALATGAARVCSLRPYSDLLSKEEIGKLADLILDRTVLELTKHNKDYLKTYKVETENVG